jgi:hypothetical protein
MAGTVVVIRWGETSGTCRLLPLWVPGEAFIRFSPKGQFYLGAINKGRQARFVGVDGVSHRTRGWRKSDGWFQEANAQGANHHQSLWIEESNNLPPQRSNLFCIHGQSSRLATCPYHLPSVSDGHKPLLGNGPRPYMSRLSSIRYPVPNQNQVECPRSPLCLNESSE